MIDLINSKYHLSVAKRMHKGFYDYYEKRFLVGVINELGKAASSLIRAYLIFGRIFSKNSKKNLKAFTEDIGPNYLEKDVLIDILKTLEIEKAQRTSKIEFVKDDKIILLVDGKYRILTAKRLLELIDSVSSGILEFPTSINR
jgi:hypothetical protein|tara:strand:- start:36 stop:464 length:429 start_codon:yes stop_codon:yes gene_type:complete